MFASFKVSTFANMVTPLSFWPSAEIPRTKCAWEFSAKKYWIYIVFLLSEIKEPKTRGRFEACSLFGSSAEKWDASQLSHYAQTGSQWYTYEKGGSIEQKIALVKSKKLGGAFIWSLELDDIENTCKAGKFYVMNKINQLLINKTFQ